MEIPDENMQDVVRYLQGKYNPDLNIAEEVLEIEVDQNYPLTLLNLVHESELDMTLRMAAAIEFQKFIHQNWEMVKDKQDSIHESIREAIKNWILTVTLSSPESIQERLSDAIIVIGKTDFPDNWPELITEMVEKFSTGDLSVINGVLRTGHSLFEKYRFQFKSKILMVEIENVLEKIGQPLTDLLVETIDLSQRDVNDVSTLEVIYSCLVLICKIFYSFNYRDMPLFFKDNMQIWMCCFHTLLIVEVKSLQNNDSEEAGLMEQLKSQVCDNIALYAQNYHEDCKMYLEEFVIDTCSLLIGIGPETKYDLIVCNALRFLSLVAEQEKFKSIFEDDADMLGNIYEKIIIPNLEFRASDEELFEKNAVQYICRDIEASENTRRSAVCYLVIALSHNFKTWVMEILKRHLESILMKYVEDPKHFWRSKDSAMYLVTSLAIRGFVLEDESAQSKRHSYLRDYCRLRVLEELKCPDMNELPVLKADAIKFIMIFRTDLPTEIVVDTLPHLIRHLRSESAVVHIYAAYTLEKLLVMQDNSCQPIVSGAELEPMAADLLSNLIAILEKPGFEHNSYVMKVIMRTFATLQEKVLPFLTIALPTLTKRLEMVAKYPTEPRFNDNLFETFSLAIRNVSAVTSFETLLLPIFHRIFEQEQLDLEFVPHVSEIIYLLMENLPPGSILEQYMQLLPFLLAPIYWERTANITQLVKLISVFAIQAPLQIVAENMLGGYLGIFQKLIASRSNDHEGFLLMQCLVQHFPKAALAPYHKQIFLVLFRRLSSSKTTKFVKNLIVFFCIFIAKYSASELIETVDDIQEEMFVMVLKKLFIADLRKVSGNIERKIVIYGITKLLCDCQEMYAGNYQEYWPQLTKALLLFFEKPGDESTLPDDHFIDVVDAPTFEAAGAKWNFTNNTQIDPLQAVAEPMQFLVQNLATLGSSQPGRLPILLSRMNFHSQLLIQRYQTRFGVQLV